MLGTLQKHGIGFTCAGLFTVVGGAGATMVGWDALWRPAPLIAARFGGAPSSRDRVDDYSTRHGPGTITVALRNAIVGSAAIIGISSNGRSTGGGSDDHATANGSAV